jgi:hypothetical protein
MVWYTVHAIVKKAYLGIDRGVFRIERSVYRDAAGRLLTLEPTAAQVEPVYVLPNPSNLNRNIRRAS